ncbi:hypothetical protein HK103_000026 [Boothiomyces macroporosus]|uniref:CATSPERG C-terminal domain-containing protein n=1 Tax=Boothiomyces macroporosus TaxID=261099 RepID=A0AAD5YBD8_9FUNG|nr:hypothetical protein HK103_000026 [Boothiomyces macroporosus]
MHTISAKYPALNVAFYPNFVIDDAITGENSSFIYDFYLQVVGGGSSNVRLTNYTTDQISSYNPNSKLSNYNSLIYIITNNDATNDFTFNGSDTSTGINWKCKAGSPCYNIPATNFGSTPFYYFTLQITAIPSSDTIETYCNLNANITVGLVHIPASLETQLLSIFITALICFFFTGIYFWFSEAIVHPATPPEEKNTVRFFNIEVDDQFERKASLIIPPSTKLHPTIAEEQEEVLDVQLKNGEELEEQSPDLDAPMDISDSSDSDIEPSGSLHALNKIGLSLSTSKLNKE